MSTLKSITASIVHGSGIGPAVYVVYASDLKAVTRVNQLCKFTVDTYLVVPTSNVDSQAAEIGNIVMWALKNNVMLNGNKLKEIFFSDCRRKRQITSPPYNPSFAVC